MDKFCWDRAIACAFCSVNREYDIEYFLVPFAVQEWFNSLPKTWICHHAISCYFCKVKFNRFFPKFGTLISLLSKCLSILLVFVFNENAL